MTCGTEKVEPSGRERCRAGDELIIEVSDNGIGVPEHLRDRLFEQFYRAHKEGDVEGSGLGLSIVRETVESLGGRAGAVFDQIEGTVFKFSIPVRRPAVPLAAEDAALSK